MFWTGPLSLLSRAIRSDALSWRWHAVRFASAAFLLILLIQAQVVTLGRGTSGRMFFEFLALLNFWLMTLIGLGFFPTAITEEKEEGTLPLLILSGMPGVSIVLAKAGGRLWSILLIFLAQLPFSFLALMLGGLTALQVLAVWFSLASYLFALAGIGVLWSVLCREGYRAARGMLASIILFNWIAPITAALVAWLLQIKAIAPQGSWISLARRAEAFGRMISVPDRIRLTLASEANIRFLQPQSLLHMAIGAGSFLLAIAVFRRATEYAHEPITRPLGLARARADRPARRPWGEPLAWKEFQFLTSGLLGFAGQSVVIAAVLGGIFYFNGPLRRYLHVDAPQFAVTGLAALFLIELVYVASRTLAWECRAGTLPTLTMLPRSLVGIVTAKLAGGVFGALPPLIALGVVGALTDTGLLIPSAGFWERLAVLTTLVCLLHLTTLYSLFYPWAAIPLALATLLLVGALTIPFAGAASYAMVGADFEGFVSIVIVYLTVIATLGMQVAILLKIRQIASS